MVFTLNAGVCLDLITDSYFLLWHFPFSSGGSHFVLLLPLHICFSAVVTTFVVSLHSLLAFLPLVESSLNSVFKKINVYCTELLWMSHRLRTAAPMVVCLFHALLVWAEHHSHKTLLSANIQFN